ncbi:2-hydroxyacid dehydrogenase [uncultured Paracoccus sp.]|uniref:2-hydroxyacid dehydrogenase n=1 Tax=uncultured Paracoccus sp. TaxID=189685 RepID=UPI00260B331C|nr:2-hydroxyacid dehydrogenase [uncultured Paracoccus sp.]
MTRVLAIGIYADIDHTALVEEEGAAMLATLDDLAGMPQADRDRIEAVAYRGHAPFGPDQMALLPRLRVIANNGVGYDAIDVAAATERGIVVTNTPGVLNDDVADLAVAMLVAQSRDFERGMRAVRDGSWAQTGELPLARKLSGRTVGILGMGRIGREIADRLVAFKCRIHYQSRTPKDTPAGWTYHADPVDLARGVDDLVVSVVGGPATEGMVSARVLDALGPDGVLVNISRGSVVDEAALIEALEQGRIRGAALDVFRNEPDVDPRLARLPNLLPLPHVGSATVETRAAMGALQRRNLRAMLEGHAPETPVNDPAAVVRQAAGG